MSQGASTVQRNVGYALCKAAGEGNKSKLEEMLQNGVSLNTCDYDGRTAAHLSASNGHLRTLEWLVSNGARVDVMDRFDNYPLDDATREGHKDVEGYLEERTLKVLFSQNSTVAQSAEKESSHSHGQKTLSLLAHERSWRGRRRSAQLTTTTNLPCPSAMLLMLNSKVSLNRTCASNNTRRPMHYVTRAACLW